ncbi:enoyl-CoA hydratase/isomerase family protein [Ilumatobacter nonamiensis]|uniref:enoyl-CoA hydratase/isomerase family protein n=1 Tax=Ilumatobacter nonamiensis TaxID=467093 RepID=UPI00034DCFB7|nr:enoyl-CoA hydratase-related protein [Ilumatobacter nonamiensis]
MNDHVRWELNDDHVGTITLDKPETHNALTHAMYDELERLVRAAPDSGARCLIVTGSDPSFCSGDDVRAVMGAGDDGAAPVLDSDGRTPSITPAADALLHTDIPVIAAVNGAAVGWGMELALFADLRVASDRARFGELFVLRGLVSDVGGIGRLAQLVGREHAAELLFTGEVIDAERAQEIGLVGRVVAHEELQSTSQGLAARIAANPPLAVQQLKAGLRRTLDPDWYELGRWVSSTLTELFGTADHREGVRAFLERRPAEFHGN